MDEFGVLVESIGFKSQEKSAPMAHMKSKPKTNDSFNNDFPQNTVISSTNRSKSTLYNDSFVDDLDGFFQSKNNSYCQRGPKFFDDGNDIFGGSFVNLKQGPASERGIDLDSVFDLKNSSSKASSNIYDDLLTSGPREGDAIDDFLGNFGMESESLKKGVEENGSQFDDLIPGFGGSSPSTGDSQNIGMDSETKFSQPSSGHSSRSSSSMADNPFLVFQSSRSSANASSWPFSDPLEPNAGKESVASAIDELEKFAMGKVPHDASDKPSVETLRNIRISLGKNGGGDRADASVSKVHIEEEILHGTQRETDKGSIQNVTKEKKEAVVDNSNLDDIFGIGTHSRHVDRARSQTEDPVFDALFHESPGPEVKKTYSGASHNKENSSSATIPFDVFSSIFGEAASSSGEFQEIEGESEERRRARLNNHMRTQAKMAKALAEMNQRDLQTQYEQEEKRRLADTLDYDIKRWSAGKEGNLRALLSSLQDVLWPESGWLAVSLTELMTSQNVKKVYYKATLCVHPDKVQQKGSNLQQKYIAEKVFDLIKEAYNKFNAQELQ